MDIYVIRNIFRKFFSLLLLYAEGFISKKQNDRTIIGSWLILNQCRIHKFIRVEDASNKISVIFFFQSDGLSIYLNVEELLIK